MPRSGRHKKNNNPFLYINFLDKESIAEKTCDELKTNSLEHTCYTIVCIDDKTFITAISFSTPKYFYILDWLKNASNYGGLVYSTIDYQSCSIKRWLYFHWNMSTHE